MSNLLPHPFLGLTLVAVWLLLTQSISVGQVLLGGIVALLATQAMAALNSRAVPIVRIRPIMKLLWIVIIDIIRSNFAVAAVVLFRRRERVSGFISMPLDIKNPNGLAMLGLIITATPGSLWVELDRRQGVLLVHVLDLIDEDEWVKLIKSRYEALLIEIFGQ